MSDKARNLKDVNEKDVAKYNLKKSDGIKGHLTFPRKQVKEEDGKYEKGVKRLRRKIIQRTVLSACM